MTTNEHPTESAVREDIQAEIDRDFLFRMAAEEGVLVEIKQRPTADGTGNLIGYVEGRYVTYQSYDRPRDLYKALLKELDLPPITIDSNESFLFADLQPSEFMIRNAAGDMCVYDATGDTAIPAHALKHPPRDEDYRAPATLEDLARWPSPDMIAEMKALDGVGIEAWS